MAVWFLNIVGTPGAGTFSERDAAEGGKWRGKEEVWKIKEKRGRRGRLMGRGEVVHRCGKSIYSH